MAATPTNLTIFGYSYDSFFIHFIQPDSLAVSWNVRYRKSGTTTWNTQNVTNSYGGTYYIDKVVQVQFTGGAAYAGQTLDIEVQSVQGATLSGWTPTATVTLIADPLVDYPLDGNLNDISFNGTNATAVGTVNFLFDAELQKTVLTLDGTNYAKASNIVFNASDNVSYTKVGWFKLTEFVESANLISSSAGNGHTAWVTHNNSTIGTTGYTLKAGHGGTLNHIVSSTLISRYRWTHFAVTYNNSTKIIKTYLDGNLTGSVTLSSNFGGTTEFNLGSYAGGNSTMKGYLSRVKWFNFALTDAQIRAIYNNESLAP